MPSADDVYITPASRKIEIYSGSAVHGLVSGSGGDVYVSGSGDLYLDAEGNNIVLQSAGTTFAKLNNNNAYWDFDGSAGSSYLRFIPWNGGAGTTAYTYWGDGTHNQVIYVRGTDSINTNSTTITNTWFGQYDGAGNLDTYLQAGGDSYILNQFGLGTTAPDEALDIVGNAQISGYISLGGSIFHDGDTDTYMGFTGGDTIEIQTGGSSRISINNSGVQLGGAGARVTEIEDNDSLGTSDTKLATQGNIKAYVDANAGGGGASSINDLSDALVENNSIWLGSDPTSTTSTASKNTAVGIEALDIITTADENTAIGYQAGDAITTGGDNTAVGAAALSTIADGVGNTAVGREAMRDIAAGGNYNTGIGTGVFGYGGGTQVGNVGAGW